MTHDDARTALGGHGSTPPARPRLTAADAAAVDAVLAEGFDPDSAAASPREAVVRRLLGSLDRLPDAAGPRAGDASLVDATLARIERFEDERDGVAADRSRSGAAILPWHRNLLGAAAAIAILLGMTVWTSGGGSGVRPGSLSAAGVLDLPDWDAAEARAYMDQRPVAGPVEGAISGELWVLQTPGGRDRVVFVADRDRLAARPVLQERGGVLLGRCLLRPQSPAIPASDDGPIRTD
jgi:hypothetical protein